MCSEQLRSQNRRAPCAAAPEMAHPASDPAGVLDYNNDETKEYLESHGVTTLMCSVLKEVVTTKPDDPIS